MSQPTQYPELEKAYRYFLSIRERYLKKHYQKFLLIHGDRVLGVFNLFDEADDEADERGLEPGTFAIQQLLKEGETPSVMFTLHN